MKALGLISALCLSVSLAAQTPSPKPAPKSAPAQTPAPKPGAAVAARLVTITAGDNMVFTPDKIPAKPGEKLKIRLMAVGTVAKMAMQHNVVVLKDEKDQFKFVVAASQARDTEYIPTDPALKAMMIAHTSLIGNGETVDLEITVPTKPGNYPYLCTFPGHFGGGARGLIVVQ